MGREGRVIEAGQRMQGYRGLGRECRDRDSEIRVIYTCGKQQDKKSGRVLITNKVLQTKQVIWTLLDAGWRLWAIR